MVYFETAFRWPFFHHNLKIHGKLGEKKRQSLILFSEFLKVVVIITYLLTPRSRVLLEKLTGPQLVNKFPAFCEPEGSLPQPQVSATCPYPKPDRSSPYPHIPVRKDPS
jgi:hypothetical protein